MVLACRLYICYVCACTKQTINLYIYTYIDIQLDRISFLMRQGFYLCTMEVFDAAAVKLWVVYEHFCFLDNIYNPQ